MDVEYFKSRSCKDQQSTKKADFVANETLHERFDGFGVSPTMAKHPKFDSNFTKGLSYDNPFAPTQRASDLFLNSSEKRKENIKNLNFPRNDFSFFQDFSQKADSVDCWTTSDSKLLKKLSKNCSQPEIYVSKFNNSEIKLKSYN